jgi:hypothetical protein
MHSINLGLISKLSTMSLRTVSSHPIIQGLRPRRIFSERNNVADVVSLGLLDGFFSWITEDRFLGFLSSFGLYVVCLYVGIDGFFGARTDIG